MADDAALEEAAPEAIRRQAVGKRRRGDRHADGFDSVASVIQRLGVLLAAGVVPASGWGYLAEAAIGGSAEILTTVAAAAARGESVPEAIVDTLDTATPSQRAVWRGLAAAWQVATDAGASLAPSLKVFAASVRDLAQTHRELGVALAGPVATARLVLVLPAIGVLFGLALGFNTLGVLFTTVPGAVCLILGLLLMIAARAWNRKLVKAAQPTQLTPGLILDLLAIAVSGGASIPRALAAVSTAAGRYGLDDDAGAEAIEGVLSLSRRAGIPAAELLRSEAEEARRIARATTQRKAATLAVTLMLPLGLCILPAFMLLGVAPLLIAVISSTVATF